MTPMTTVTVSDTVSINPALIPAWVGENLAQAAFPGIQRAWRDPVIRADYEKWKKERYQHDSK